MKIQKHTCSPFALINLGVEAYVSPNTTALLLGARISGWLSTGFTIERLQVQIPAGAMGECSFPEITFCVD